MFDNYVEYSMKKSEETYITRFFKLESAGGIVLMIATGVIYIQMQYSINRDPGFNKDNLLVINQINIRPEQRNRIKTQRFIQ